MAYCTQTDLENAVGGSAILVQLLDPLATGTANAARVTAVLDRASAEVASAIQVSTSLSALSAPYPDALIFNTANIAAYYAFLEGTQGQGVPEHIKQRYTNTMEWLDKVANRTRSLGASTKPATDHDVKQIEMNPASNPGQVTRASLKYFW